MHARVEHLVPLLSVGVITEQALQREAFVICQQSADGGRLLKAIPCTDQHDWYLLCCLTSPDSNVLAEQAITRSLRLSASLSLLWQQHAIHSTSEQVAEHHTTLHNLIKHACDDCASLLVTEIAQLVHQCEPTAYLTKLIRRSLARCPLDTSIIDACVSSSTLIRMCQHALRIGNIFALTTAVKKHVSQHGKIPWDIGGRVLRVYSCWGSIPAVARLVMESLDTDEVTPKQIGKIAGILLCPEFLTASDTVAGHQRHEALLSAATEIICRKISLSKGPEKVLWIAQYLLAHNDLATTRDIARQVLTQGKSGQTSLAVLYPLCDFALQKDILVLCHHSIFQAIFDSASISAEHILALSQQFTTDDMIHMTRLNRALRMHSVDKKLRCLLPILTAGDVVTLRGKLLTVPGLQEIILSQGSILMPLIGVEYLAKFFPRDRGGIEQALSWECIRQSSLPRQWAERWATAGDAEQLKTLIDQQILPEETRERCLGVLAMIQ